MSSKPNPGSSGGSHRAEFRDGYSEERQEWVQRPGNEGEQVKGWEGPSDEGSLDPC